MRKTVLVPVEKRLCDAHVARDGSEVEASSTLTLGRHAWDLCMEHDVVFGRYLCDALGVPVVEDASDDALGEGQGQAKGAHSVRTLAEPEGRATLVQNESSQVSDLVEPTLTTTQSSQVKGVATVYTPEPGSSPEGVHQMHTPAPDSSPEGVHPMDTPEPEGATAIVQTSQGPGPEAGASLIQNEGPQASEPVQPTFDTTESSQVSATLITDEGRPGSAPVPSVMLAGEVPGYSWDDARQALRSAGYEVVGRADETTVLLILGERGEHAAKKLQDAHEHDIPCMDVRALGRFKAAVLTGEFIGRDPLPEPAKAAPSGMSERERNRAVRVWARANGFTVPDRGRIPMNVRHAWKLAHQAEAVAA
ncbi:Lsr2 family protein [Streptomyces sp. ET3-23]|uniref:Lsr2 family DNA-binding protein n=1 Tax=Streptomyces sp. ET3-23 TaxID=2885643 RepID=UPI001D110B46|nr:histone-like nucleoid-structuring protein Lsr2 [Streptomyces sp. ET3-23]MCC2278504.1 Lsr2 family protein [Streptomyces sp. ET3-23]